MRKRPRPTRGAIAPREKKNKMKETLYRPGQALKVPGSNGFQILTDH